MEVRSFTWLAMSMRSKAVSCNQVLIRLASVPKTSSIFAALSGWIHRFYAKGAQYGRNVTESRPHEALRSLAKLLNLSALESIGADGSH